MPSSEKLFPMARILSVSGLDGSGLLAGCALSPADTRIAVAMQRIRFMASDL